MADPFTHIFLGMAISPQHPVLGAIAGILADGAQLAAAIRYRTGSIWSVMSAGFYKANDELHRVVWPVVAILACVLLGWWDFVPLVLAFGSHVVLDIFTHDDTSALYPFVGKPLHLGRTFHSFENMRRGTWPIVLLMVGGSLAWSIVRGAW